ncbi:MAG: citrate/2-methylcitrate synthase [Ilumatobacteraceae bacterium]
MTTLIGSHEAAHLLGVSRPTLYAYVSRRLVSRQVAVDGRTSLYDRVEIEQLAGRSGRGRAHDRPSIDVQISTAVTRLDDDGPTVRGRSLLELADRHSYEHVAELLMTGELPDGPVIWRPARSQVEHARSIDNGLDPIVRLSMVALGSDAPRGHESAATVGRQLLAVAPSLLGGPTSGDLATRLSRAWTRTPSPELVHAISQALILLADHELATSTLAVRLAASVRSSPAAALATGLNVVGGSLHGAASRAAAELFGDAAERGARAAIRDRLDAGHRLPGFGHSVYRNGDPRFEPLLRAVRGIPDADLPADVIDAVLAESGRTVGVLPNVDLALGALTFVAGLPADAPLFAIARIPGWVAHYQEELTERPLRFRGLARSR